MSNQYEYLIQDYSNLTSTCESAPVQLIAESYYHGERRDKVNYQQEGRQAYRSWYPVILKTVILMFTIV